MSQTPATIDPVTALRIESAQLSLHSVFQPIVSIAHSRVVGHEALLRGRSDAGMPLSPAELFPRLAGHLTHTAVNESCSRLHLTSFSKRNRGGWLFLNVSPAAMADRDTVSAEFGSWLKDSGVQPHQVVVEIIETRVYNEARLEAAVQGFRDLGCLVAIDDFGAGESNFERIWRLRPDLVKIDREMIAQASDNPLVRRLLPGIVALLHEAGCLVVIEGIETEVQALIALESGADFVQGYFFSHPSAECVAEGCLRQLFSDLEGELKRGDTARSELDQGLFHSFAGGLEACASAIADGIDFTEACSLFLALSGVQRVYQLSKDGYQVGPNAEAPRSAIPDLRFEPCADAAGANWYRRPYFQRALNEPGRVQVSRPYLSVRDAKSCVTLSLGVEVDGQFRVVCADLDHEQAAPLSGRRARESGIHLR